MKATKAERASRKSLREAVAAARAPFDWDSFLARAAGRILARGDLPASLRETSPAELEAAVAPHGYRAIFPAELPGGQMLFWPAAGTAPMGDVVAGAVFTRPQVVGFILDLIGYTADKPLYRQTILEPSFGGGDFLLPIVERLFASCQRSQSQGPLPLDLLKHAVRAVELNESLFHSTRETLRAFLRGKVTEAEGDSLVNEWLVRDDFLLTSFDFRFDYVAGNPPYIRQERIPDALMTVYRQRYATLYDRADIYVAFYEHSLEMLAAGGALGFICSDRWTKNRYGSVLRGMVARGYHLKAYVDMTGVDAFRTAVTAYPAVTVISREPAGPTRFTAKPDLEPVPLSRLARALTDGQPGLLAVSQLEDVVNGSRPWVFAQDALGLLLKRLERDCPSLEEAGCRVGIGVATGADSVFIGRYEELDVEDERKLPLVMHRDLAAGEVRWQGYGVINPFGQDGNLVDLAAWPRLARYLERNREVLSARHCAKKNERHWYRTIDRIYPDLVKEPKLLIPDLNVSMQVVYDEGRFYPHHNLYYVVSCEWDLMALRAVLNSALFQATIAAYSTRMNGGCLRFQAQYLRCFRLPKWPDVPSGVRARLVSAGRTGNPSAIGQAVAELYHLSKEEESALWEVSHVS